MPFNKGSRHSSKTSSVESLPGPSTQKEEIASTEDVAVYLTEEELKDVLRNLPGQDDISKTLVNPLGKFVVHMGTNYNKMLDISKSSADRIPIADLCKAFQDHVSVNESHLKTEIEKSNKELQETLHGQSLSFHMYNPLIRCPTRFSPTPTLLTVGRQVEANKLFPQGRQRSSGDHGGSSPPITEWIYAMNVAQEKLNLSEDEFKERMLLSTTSAAHRMLRNLIQEGDNVGGIYHKLMLMHDNTMKPERAKEELLRFKISRNSTINRGQGHIMELATAAARIFPEGDLRKSYSNSEACLGLIRSLPITSSTIVNTAYNRLISVAAQQGKIALYTDLMAYLNPYHTQINEDIKRNGKIYEPTGNRTQRNFRTEPYFSSRPQHQPLRKLQLHNLNRTPYQNRSDRGPKNKYMNSLYCSLCGQNNHRASEGCYKMRDERGRTVPVVPAQVPCTVCEKKINKKLYHPLKYCFNKTQNLGSQNKTPRI